MQINYKSSPLFGTGAKPATLDAIFQQAVQLHQSGQLAQAKQLYEKVLSVQGNHFQALHLLGVMAFQTGNYQFAVDLIGRAIHIDPSHAAFHCNLGNAYLRLKQFDTAIASYDKALELKSDFTDALANRGVALADMLQFDAAVASYDKAIASNPRYADAYYNRGNALLELQQYELALASYDAAIALRPDFADIYCAKGVALKSLGQLDEATANFRQALTIDPRSNAAHCNLANALLEQDKLSESLASYINSLRLGDSMQAKKGFVQCIKRSTVVEANAEVTGLLVRAIQEAWTRPAQLFATAIKVIKVNPDVRAIIDRANGAWPERLSSEQLFGSFGLTTIANNPLILSVLQCMPISSIEFERFLTLARSALLRHCFNANHIETNDPALGLMSAIAQQCYTNEYAFAASEAETTQIQALQSRLDVALQAQALAPNHWVAAVAAYGPLSRLKSVDALSKLTLSHPVRDLLRQQVLEPATEYAHRPLVPKLTNIEDSVSLAVQEQYEQNPYPRWVNTSAATSTKTVTAYLRQQFPTALLQPNEQNAASDILIAGCGTGQQSIDAANLFPDSNVLAIDLSLSSLCYALRKSAELGIRNLEYAQADIMALGSIDRMFDVIESVGVLHHLADPIAGWRVLTRMLKPGGYMRLGFYSELARKNIVQAREFIAQRGYSTSLADIQRCRQDIMSDAHRGRFNRVLSFRDFFSTSECRDLLFHVQEHRFTVPQIKTALDALGLNFIGFSLEAQISNAYHAVFTDDLAQTNLDNWHLFETENPDTFAGMYQFWVQRNT